MNKQTKMPVPPFFFGKAYLSSTIVTSYMGQGNPERLEIVYLSNFRQKGSIAAQAQLIPMYQGN